LILSEIVTCLDKEKTSKSSVAASAATAADTNHHHHHHHHMNNDEEREETYLNYSTSFQPSQQYAAGNVKHNFISSFFCNCFALNVDQSLPFQSQDLHTPFHQHNSNNNILNNTVSSQQSPFDLLRSSAYKPPPIWNNILAQRANTNETVPQQQQQQQYVRKNNNHSFAASRSSFYQDNNNQQNTEGEGDERMEDYRGLSEEELHAYNRTLSGMNESASSSVASSSVPIATTTNLRLSSTNNNSKFMTRLCITQGSLVKSFEEYPLRIDLEANAVDVVWRETRYPSASSSSSSAQTTNHILYVEPPKVLRRERFRFDTIYPNQQSERFYMQIKSRTRQALLSGTNVNFLCTGCGDIKGGELEPPVTVVLGSGGGTGVTSVILEEIFSFLHPKTNQLNESNRNNTSSSYAPNHYLLHENKARTLKTGHANQQNAFVACRVNAQTLASRVTMSVILTKGNQLFDLCNQSVLHQMRGDSSISSGPIIASRTGSPDGPIALLNATLIDLRNAYDFERIVGLLLGRRVGIFEALQSMNSNKTMQQQQQQGGGNNDVLKSHATWNTSHLDSHQHHGYDPSIYGEDNLFITSNLLISIHVSYGIAKHQKNQTIFRLVCPCGDTWAQPGKYNLYSIYMI